MFDAWNLHQCLIIHISNNPLLLSFAHHHEDVFLQDISAINHDHPDYTAEKPDIINFVKWRCFSKLLIPFHQQKNYPYTLSSLKVCNQVNIQITTKIILTHASAELISLLLLNLSPSLLSPLLSCFLSLVFSL